MKTRILISLSSAVVLMVGFLVGQSFRATPALAQDKSIFNVKDKIKALLSNDKQSTDHDNNGQNDNVDNKDANDGIHDDKDDTQSAEHDNDGQNDNVDNKDANDGIHDNKE